MPNFSVLVGEQTGSAIDIGQALLNSVHFFPQHLVFPHLRLQPGPHFGNSRAGDLAEKPTYVGTGNRGVLPRQVYCVGPVRGSYDECFFRNGEMKRKKMADSTNFLYRAGASFLLSEIIPKITPLETILSSLGRI